MLLKKSDLPEWYTTMEFIETGYRRPQSAFSTFYTIFQWHNETLNIYTHLLPGLWFLYNLLDLPYQQFYKDSSNYAKFCIISGYTNAIVLLFASSFAHTFHIVNKNCNTKCWTCDFVGIIVINLGRHYVDTYLLCISIFKSPLLFITCVTLETLFALYTIYQIMYMNRGRFWGMTYPAITALVPFLYVSYTEQLLYEATLYSLTCSAYILIAGSVFYKGKFPERFYNKNGIFDCFNSHIYHHICIVLSIYSAMKIAPLLHKL
jgi:adiponectin receptor